MVINFVLRRPSQRQWAIIGGSLAIITLLILVVTHSPGSLGGSSTTQKFYTKQLDELSVAVADLSKFVQIPPKPVNIKSNMAIYDQKLAAVEQPCHEMINSYNIVHAGAKSKPAKTGIENSKRLCGDLLHVTNYSKNVYSAARPYLLFGRAWPAPTDQLYAKDLADARQSIADTKATFKTIDNTKVTDPGLSELTDQLIATDTQAAKISDALSSGDTQTATELSAPFTTQLDKDKINFLNARSYYWNNTINTTQLQNAIKHMQVQINK